MLSGHYGPLEESMKIINDPYLACGYAWAQPRKDPMKYFVPLMPNMPIHAHHIYIGLNIHLNYYIPG